MNCRRRNDRGKGCWLQRGVRPLVTTRHSNRTSNASLSPGQWKAYFLSDQFGLPLREIDPQFAQAVFEDLQRIFSAACHEQHPVASAASMSELPQSRSMRLVWRVRLQAAKSWLRVRRQGLVRAMVWCSCVCGVKWPNDPKLSHDDREPAQPKE
jgi:hypothetical protein